MNINDFNEQRKVLNNLMSENDEFFNEFGQLDNKIYIAGAIPQKYKELTGLAISVINKCEECILYHLQNCIAEKASKYEIIEAIKIAVIGGGSLIYPSARFAFKAMKKMEII